MIAENPKNHAPAFATMHAMATMTASTLRDFVAHWLSTPVNGYLGSDYGCDVKALLQNPFVDGQADVFLQKMKEDLIAIYALPEGSVNLYSVKTPPDKMELLIEVAGQTITIPTINGN